MEDGKELAIAQRLAAAHKYGKLVRYLEPLIPMYRDSAQFYSLLGLACLYTEDIGGAFTYYRRTEQIDPFHVQALLALGALAMRRGETTKALDYYLRVIELKPRDRLAKAALNFIRKPHFENRLAYLLDHGKFKKFYPRYNNPLPVIFSSVTIVLAIMLIYYLFLNLPTLYTQYKITHAPRPQLESINLSKLEELDPQMSANPSATAPRYTLSAAQILDSFNKAKKYFNAYQDNLALVEVNRLRASNAQESIKAKAEQLINFVSPPDFRTLKDNIEYSQVKTEPSLYDGITVIWRGRAANIKQENGEYNFNFLVGYDSKAIIEAVLLVHFKQAASIPEDKAFELLAKVHSSDGNIVLEGYGIRLLEETK